MTHTNKGMIAAILDAILGHPERYSDQQLSVLETGLRHMQKEVRKEEEIIDALDSSDAVEILLADINVA